MDIVLAARFPWKSTRLAVQNQICLGRSGNPPEPFSSTTSPPPSLFTSLLFVLCFLLSFSPVVPFCFFSSSFYHLPLSLLPFPSCFLLLFSLRLLISYFNSLLNVTFYLQLFSINLYYWIIKFYFFYIEAMKISKGNFKARYFFIVVSSSEFWIIL